MRKSTLSFLSILVLLTANASASQRTFVSAGGGDDTNPCTRQLPCRNFAAAVLLTDPHGEVVALDSGGYGPVTINKSLSLISPSGVHAGVTAFTGGDAIDVVAADTDYVVLRNLALSSQGATWGISVTSAAAVHVDGCLINGFANGIRYQPTTANAQLYVNNVVIRRSGGNAVSVLGGSSVAASIEDSKFYENPVGVAVRDATATVRRCIASGATSQGFIAFTISGTARMDIEESVSTYGGAGFAASGNSIVNLARCDTSFNTWGIEAATGGTIYVSDSTIAANTTGLFIDTGTPSFVYSRGNNTLQANTTNNTFSGTFAAQ